MSTQETAAPGADKQAHGNAPTGPKQKNYITCYRDGPIAVFEKESKTDGSRYFQLADDSRGLKYVMAPGSIHGEPIGGEDVAHLYKSTGNTLFLNPKKSNGEGTYGLAVGATHVEVKPNEKVPEHPLRSLNLVFAFPISDKQKGPDAPVEAFLVPATKGGDNEIKVWRNVGPRSDPVQLGAADAYLLVTENRVLEKYTASGRPMVVKSMGIKETVDEQTQRTFKSAQIVCEFKQLDQQQGGEQQTAHTAGRARSFRR